MMLAGLECASERAGFILFCSSSTVSDHRAGGSLKLAQSLQSY
jgi:hypothetical protein